MLTPESALRKDKRQSTSPSFQHRHYAEIARIIRDMRQDGDELTGSEVDHIAQIFARELRGTNPHFDRSRFLRACDVED